jgi:transcriptional regulator with XRE-family HTH domain
MAKWRRVHEAEGLGAAIAQLRRSQGLTQGELSEWLGVDRSTVVRLEAGDARQLRRLMDALSVLGADLVVVDRIAHVTVTDPAGAEPDATTA